MFLSIISVIGAEPVTVDQAREKTGEYHIDTATSAALQDFITGAREDAENFTQRGFVTKKLRLTLDNWPNNRTYLPYGPLISVEKVTVTDLAGTVHNITDQYFADTAGSRLVRKEGAILPAIELREASAVTVEYTAGEIAVPEIVKQACLLWITANYDTVPESEWRGAFEKLLWPMRRVPI